MHGYIGLLWDASDPHTSARARTIARRLEGTPAHWLRAFDGEGLVIFHSGGRPHANEAHVLHAGGGVIIGSVFTRSVSSQELPHWAALDETSSGAIVASGGKHLIDHYWGRYVAFLKNAARDRVFVLRDPSGALPCYFTTHDGIELYFSDMEICASLDIRRFSINWKFVAAHAAFPGLQISDTGLNEVSELQPGECIEIAGRNRRRWLYWHPARIASTDPIEDVGQAATMLRETARACTDAWASGHGNVLHRLSGGLDSSIVLSCLHSARARPKITCLNYYTPEAEGDERRFARLAAARAECRLIENERNSSMRLDALLSIARFARPWPCAHYIEYSRIETQTAREVGATAVFTGGGGDGLFYQARAPLAAADYALRHRLHHGLLGVALDAARVERVSMWSVLRTAFRHGLLGQRWDPYADIGKYQELISDATLQSVSPDWLSHIWLREAGDLCPGKLWHIQTISVPPAFYNPLGHADVPERVHPLVSQPLMEVCLRIPTYVLVTGGWDRSIARRAFSGHVPREIINRRTKGGVNEHVKVVFERNLDFVRELMLDGQLVKEGILDRKKVEAMVSKDYTQIGYAFTEVHDHIATEAWLRSWRDQRQRAAA